MPLKGGDTGLEQILRVKNPAMIEKFFNARTTFNKKVIL